MLFILLAFAAVVRADPGRTQLVESPASWANINHVVIVVFENGDPDDVVELPYFNELSKRGAFLSRFYGVTHPSQPNYIAMVAGSTLRVTHNHPVQLQGNTIADLLEQQGKSWKVYAEDYPGNCYLGKLHGRYARKHVPFLSFENIQSDPDRCNQVVNASQFMTDINAGQLPTYTLYIPNMDNNGHDMGMKHADNWLSGSFSSIFDNEELLKDTLFILTFDEDNYLHANRIYTVLLGAGVAPGSEVDTVYNHYNMLRTIEEIFGLGDLGRHDARSDPIMGIWQ